VSLYYSVFLEMIYGCGSLRLILCLSLILVTTACSSLSQGENDDPLEGFNRKAYEFNKALDKNLLRPLAMTYAGYVPKRLQVVISSVAENLSTPGDVVNNLLQGDLESGVKNTAKFALNSTLGVGGIMRPSEVLDIQDKRADFGQTLHVWGVQEGPFLVLPFLGPSTGRDTFGILGDLTIDPIGRVVTADARAYTYGIKVADVLGNRAGFSEMYDSVLYGSADGYLQTKLMYLQARRFELDGAQEEDYFDPYEEMFE
jgi:phospholipid-binding lipoprotein MlaA